MKRKLVTLAMVICTVTALTGCRFKASKAFVYKVDTGDKVEVALDTTKGYDLTSDNPFEVSCDDEVLTVGTFLYEEGFEMYEELIENDDNSELLDSGEKDGNEYLFWNYNDEEYNYVIKVDGTDTVILLSNTESEESAKECFERLTFEEYEED